MGKDFLRKLVRYILKRKIVHNLSAQCYEKVLQFLTKLAYQMFLEILMHNMACFIS